MPRYIAEDDVYKLFNARGVAQLHVSDIDVLSRVDVKKVVHGRWLHHYHDSGELIDDKWYCSECHMCNGSRRTWYCPNCGAKMDLED